MVLMLARVMRAMTPNAIVGVAVVLALPLTPLLLLLSPFLLLWWRSQWRQSQAAGYRALPWCLVRTLVAHAEATMPLPPRDGFEVVARNVDRYLHRVRSPRAWRSIAVLMLHEFSPCLLLRRPLSRQTLADRRRWIEGPLATSRGLFAMPALVRQLVRMGYYGDRSVAQALGFLAMRQRIARVEALASMAPRREVG